RAAGRSPPGKRRWSLSRWAASASITSAAATRAVWRTRPSPTGRGSPTRRARSCTRTAASRGTSRRGRRLARRKKKPAGGELTAAERGAHRKLGANRGGGEDAPAGGKRRPSVKGGLRNKAEGTSDAVMEVACGLHNVRVEKRQRRRGT